MTAKNAGAGLWRVIHMAPGQAAGKAKAILESEGMLVRLTPVYKGAYGENDLFRIMVLQSESLEARNLLIERALL